VNFWGADCPAESGDPRCPRYIRGFAPNYYPPANKGVPARATARRCSVTEWSDMTDTKLASTNSPEPAGHNPDARDNWSHGSRTRQPIARRMVVRCPVEQPGGGV